MSLAGLATVVATEDAVPAEIKENSILELDLDIQMFDNVGATQELEEALGLGEPALKFYDVVSAIRKAAAEDNIKGINLKCQFPIMGWSQAQTIRKALKEFKDAANSSIAMGIITVKKDTIWLQFQILFSYILWAEWSLKAWPLKYFITKISKKNMGLRWRSFVMENTKAQLSRISKMR